MLERHSSTSKEVKSFTILRTGIAQSELFDKNNNQPVLEINVNIHSVTLKYITY